MAAGSQDTPRAAPSSDGAGKAVQPRLTVVLTRPDGQSGALATQLKQAGVATVDFPLIEIAPVADEAPLRAAFAGLANYALVVFV